MAEIVISTYVFPHICIDNGNGLVKWQVPGLSTEDKYNSILAKLLYLQGDLSYFKHINYESYWGK